MFMVKHEHLYSSDFIIDKNNVKTKGFLNYNFLFRSAKFFYKMTNFKLYGLLLIWEGGGIEFKGLIPA